MIEPPPSVVLASRSPRRFELLAHLVPAKSIRVLPPMSHEEAGFFGLTTLEAIEHRAAEIAAAKCDDVCRQLAEIASHQVVIAADTVVVAGGGESPFVPLGQPPEPQWQETVRSWFRLHYAGQTHQVLTAVCVATAETRRQKIVRTRVTFRQDVEPYLDWYLDTGESRGKAGGYAVQGAGSVFIDRIEGSLSNVVGLPLRELLEMLSDAGVL